MSTAGHALEDRPPTRHVRLKKVLVVDRDEYWGPAMRLALEEDGFYLNLVADPAEGRRRARERVYDLVVLSASIGASWVTAVLDTLARFASPPPVIVVAGAGEPARRQGRDRAAGLTFLRRPCPVEEVVDAARRLVGQPWTEGRPGA
jgi:DNA-binding response OmpR family regulator